jgi:TfoX/Sxy family transcriptional regulator of competence genes
MAYDEKLAKRIDELTKGKKGFSSKEMFGGVGYMLKGNMCVGVHKNDLIVRFDPKITEELMNKKNVKPFDITGRTMKGWLLVSAEGLKANELNKWFELALGFVKELPAKE